MSVQSTAVAVSSVAAAVLSSVTTDASVQNPVRLTMRASAPLYLGPGTPTSGSYKVSTAFPFDLTLTRGASLSAISSAATTATLWVIAAK